MKRFIGILWVWVSFVVQADVMPLQETNQHINLKVTERYVLGDNDTLTDAKKVVLEQAKNSATDYAGSYVESSLSVSGNQITKQQIRVLTAGFLEVLNSDYKRSVNASGSVVLDVTATIKLSKESINDGLAKLKSDPERQAKIESLEKDNQRLHNELLELTKKINSTDTSRTDLMKAREAILSDLNNNRTATKQVFEQGTLFQLAELDDQDFEMAKRDIDENVFGYMKHEMKVSLGKPSFHKNDKGNYNISVPVQWNLKMSPAKEVLSKYLTLTDRIVTNHMRKPVPYSIGIEEYENTGDSQRDTYTHKLIEHIFSNAVVIRVSGGKSYGYLPIGLNGENLRSTNYALQFSNDSKNNRMIRNSIRNPVIIKDVTENELRKITALEADVVILDIDKLRRWKYE